MKKVILIFIWLGVAILGAVAFGMIAFVRGEPINAAWLLVAALCTYAIGLRFYSKWIAAKVLTLNDRRATPAEVHDDGRDFCKTNQWIVFGHHFAAISGPGPLIGPVLAAQFGYLPGTLWILVGVLLGGAVQDFLILFCSMRRDGKSLVEMVREEIHRSAGTIALLAVLSILIVLVAGLGLIVTNALAESPWGIVTTALTIPFAMLMGCYLRYWRLGKVLEITAIGVGLLFVSLWVGHWVSADAHYAPMFTWSKKTIALCVIAYGFVASVLPVWLLLAPRDYLVTFLKIGVVLLLAVGIVLVLPPLHMPAVTKFVDGTGPVVAGKLFPFCFITIACGAISGFHSLVSSGTTPKLITRERFARPIGYGAMCMESFVAVMAMIAACVLDPGAYYAINSPAALAGKTNEEVAAKVSEWGFPIKSEQIQQLAGDIGEKSVLARTGGAPTLAIGMATIFHRAFGGAAMAFWYHFAILFEAMFILTTVDVSTRIGRFLLQELGGRIWKPLGDTKSDGASVGACVLFAGAWGYFLYAGVTDPLGGINSLWPLFGISNQLLAVVALCLATTVLIKMGKPKFVWVTLVPMAWLVTVTFTAGYQKIFSPVPRIGFLALAKKLSVDLAAGTVPPEKVAATQAQIFNNHLDAVVAGVFLMLVVAILVISIREWILLLTKRREIQLREAPAVWLAPAVLAAEATPRWKWLTPLFLAVGLARHLADEPKDAKPTAKEFCHKLEDKFNQPNRCC